MARDSLWKQQLCKLQLCKQRLWKQRLWKQRLWKQRLSKQRLLKQRLWKLGQANIGLGMLVIVAAQFWTVLPVVTAIALIGRGAILTLQARPRTSRQDSLLVGNLTVYAALVCLAIVAQSNLTLQSSLARVSLGMLLDHAVAIVLVVGLIFGVYARLSQPTA